MLAIFGEFKRNIQPRWIVTKTRTHDHVRGKSSRDSFQQVVRLNLSPVFAETMGELFGETGIDRFLQSGYELW